jgi:hypothetical protein
MSDDFEERLQRAAKMHAAKSDANGRAKQVQEGERDAFLVQFYDLSRNVIEPVLDEAKQLIKAPGKVTAKVKRSDDEDSIYLSLADGRKMSILVFVADPLLMRVRVHSTTQIEMEDLDSVTRWRDARNGTGDNPVRDTMALGDIKAAAIKFYATEFGVRALA